MISSIFLMENALEIDFIFQNLYVKIQALNMIIFGEVAFGRHRGGHEGEKRRQVLLQENAMQSLDSFSTGTYKNSPYNHIMRM